MAQPNPNPEKFRLITRSDMDGLISAVILKELALIDDVKFVHPKDMQDGLIEVTNKDITTNLPYVSGVHLAFDHHESEVSRIEGKPENHIIDPKAPSAARVVYDYYDGQAALPMISEKMMLAVDKADSAQFSKQDILNPQGWELLSFLMDARTGLGRFRTFRLSNYQLMMALIDYCRTHQNIDDILALPDVKERVDLYREHEEKFKEQIKRCTTVHKNLAVLDLRDEEIIWPGNRFMIYALFPEINISMHVLWGKAQQNIVFAVGKSILDRSCSVNIGDLMLTYKGGGHNAAGTCQVDIDDAARVQDDLMAQIIKGE